MAFTLTPKLEIGFATDAPFTSPITWTDATSKLISSTWSRGRDRELDQCGSGGGSTAVDNSERDFEAGWSGGAYYPDVIPSKWIRLSMTLDGVTTVCFTHMIMDIVPQWESPVDEVATIEHSDVFSLLSITPVDGLFSQQTASARTAAILDAIGFPATWRDITAGGTILPAKTYVTTDNQTALPYLQLVNESTLGLLFIDGRGYVVMRPSGTGTGALPYTLGYGGVDFTGAAPHTPVDKVFNDVRVTREGSTVQQRVTDSTSIGKHGRRLLTKSILAGSDSAALAVANSYLSRYKWPKETFDSISVQPMTKSAYQLVLAAEVGKTGTVSRRSDNGAYSAAVVLNHMSNSIENQDSNVAWKANYRMEGRTIS